RKQLGRRAVVHAVEAHQQTILRRTQARDLELPRARLVFQRLEFPDRKRIVRIDEQPDFAAQSMRGSDLRDADPLCGHTNAQLAGASAGASAAGASAAGAGAGFAGFGAAAAAAAASARAFCSLRGTARSGLL